MAPSSSDACSGTSGQNRGVKIPQRACTQRGGDDLALAGRGICIFSWRGSFWPHRAAFFPECEVLPVHRAATADIWIGWGRSVLSQAVQQAAKRSGKRFLRIEDGFLRSIGLGKAGALPISVVVDDLGLHIEAATPCRLEDLIATTSGTDWQAIGATVRSLWLEAGVSKYNIGARRTGPENDPTTKAQQSPRIVLVDQVKGDRSIAGALAGPEAFERMLLLASQQSGSRVLLRRHPDVAAGFRRGYLEHGTDARRFETVPDDWDAAAVLSACDEVWTVSSQLGFEALMHGRSVTTFGVPFYAGFGLTKDCATRPAAVEALARRTAKASAEISIETMIAASLVRYPRYADPDLTKPLTVFEAIETVKKARDHADTPKSEQATEDIQARARMS